MTIDKNIFSLKDPRSELMTYDDSCIDLVVTAPPVFTMKGKEVYYNDTNYSWDTFDEYIDYMGTVFTEVYRMLKNRHYCIITVGDSSTLVGDRLWDTKTYPLAAHFTKLLEWIGFTYVSEYTIDKGGKALAGTGRKDCYPFMVSPVNSTEHVLIFVKNENTNTPIPCPRCGNKDTKGYGYTVKGDKRWACYNCWSWGHVFYERSIMINSYRTEENLIPTNLFDKWSRGVVQVSPIFKDESKHRYLPYEVAEMAILFYSGVGDIVLDPFSGVGCALLTAVKFKRRFVCFERDKQEVNLFLDGLRVSLELFEKANKEAESGYEKEENSAADS